MPVDYKNVIDHVFTSWDSSAEVIPLERKLSRLLLTHEGFGILEMPADPEWLRREWQDMQHCLSVAHHAYSAAMSRGETRQFSLIDLTTGEPHVDIELAVTQPSYSGPVKVPTVTQIRGKRNQCPPDDRFIPLLFKFLNQIVRKNGWAVWNQKNPNFDGKFDGYLVWNRAKNLGLKSES